MAQENVTVTGQYPSWTYQTGSGRLHLHLVLWDTGNGLQALLTGGEKPHIGGVVLAVPRPSLSGNGWSADLYMTPVPNHKDADLARPLAESLARLSRTPVVVTAGIHSDALTPAELESILHHFSTLMQTVLEEMTPYFSSKEAPF